MKPLLDKSGRYLSAPEDGIEVWFLLTIKISATIYNHSDDKELTYSGLVYDSLENRDKAFELRRAAQAYRLAAAMANEKYEDNPYKKVHVIGKYGLALLVTSYLLADKNCWLNEIDAEAYAKEVGEELIIQMLRDGWL